MLRLPTVLHDQLVAVKLSTGELITHLITDGVRLKIDEINNSEQRPKGKSKGRPKGRIRRHPVMLRLPTVLHDQLIAAKLSTGESIVHLITDGIRLKLNKNNNVVQKSVVEERREMLGAEQLRSLRAQLCQNHTKENRTALQNLGQALWLVGIAIESENKTKIQLAEMPPKVLKEARKRLWASGIYKYKLRYRGEGPSYEDRLLQKAQYVLHSWQRAAAAHKKREHRRRISASRNEKLKQFSSSAASLRKELRHLKKQLNETKVVLGIYVEETSPEAINKIFKQIVSLTKVNVNGKNVATHGTEALKLAQLKRLMLDEIKGEDHVEGTR